MILWGKYNQAYTFTFELYELDGTDLQTGAVHAAGDTKIDKDGAGEGNTTNGFTDEGQGYSLVLTATEMTAARIVIYIVDQTGPKAWHDRVIHIQTYGNASAQHAFDLDTATQPVNLTQMGGVTQSATDLKDFADDGYNPATDKVTGVLLTDTCTTLTNKTGFSLAADQSGVTIGTVNTASVLTTNNDKTGYALSAAGIDSIWDEVIEGTLTGRQTLRLNMAALCGKSSGGGTATITFRDTGDSTDRIVATVTSAGNRTAVVLDGT